MNFLNRFVICFLAIEHFQINKAQKLDKQPIINGILARPREIKFIVTTLHDNSWYRCGGGIIDDYFIITAAHCFFNDKDELSDKEIKIVAGTNDIYNVQDPKRIEVPVEKLYMPSSYDNALYPGDIAVLKLKTSLNITNNGLQKLSIPTRDTTADFTGRKALVAGFGFDRHRLVIKKETNTTEETGSTDGRLRKAQVLIYSNSECQTFYDEIIHKSYLCGKMLKRSKKRPYGVCNGDSGGPLVLNEKVLIGVVSWSYGCDERKIPIIYTRVTSYLDFIKKAMNDETDDMIYKIYQ